jgi:hypothetical protein
MPDILAKSAKSRYALHYIDTTHFFLLSYIYSQDKEVSMSSLLDERVEPTRCTHDYAWPQRSLCGSPLIPQKQGEWVCLDGHRFRFSLPKEEVSKEGH